MNKGNYYKYKTKKYFEEQGYQAELLEKTIRYLDKQTNKIVVKKKDVFGSDLLIMNEEEIVFIQVKYNKTHIAEAIKEFKKIKFPPFVKFWVVCWMKNEQTPYIYDLKEVKDE